MAKGKLKRKLTAIVYSKKKLNRGMVTAYKGYKEVRDVLNGDGRLEKQRVKKR